MLMTAESEPMTIAPEDLAPIRALYEEGLCLRAYELARALGPLERWRGTEARILAGGLAAHLGSPRLGTALHVRAWREAPTDPEACFYLTFALLSHRGPLRTWEFLREVGPLAEAPDRVPGYWLSMHAIVLGQFRDFDAAEAWLARADEVSPGYPWLLVQRAGLLAMEDRYDDALAAAREALSAAPGIARRSSRRRTCSSCSTATRRPSRSWPSPPRRSRAAAWWRSSASSRPRWAATPRPGGPGTGSPRRSP